MCFNAAEDERMADWKWALGIQRPAALAISAGFVSPRAPYCADVVALAAASPLARLVRGREACAAGAVGLPQ